MVARNTPLFPAGKRGYFFVVDAVIATAIVMLGIFLLFSSSFRSFGQEQPLRMLEDSITIMNARTLSESTNRYYTQSLLPARVVPIPDMTPLEEVGYLALAFEETANVTYANHASNFTASLFNDSIDARYGASLTINGTLVYARTNPATEFSIARTLVLYVRMNETALRGPLLGEVRLWY